MYIYKKDLIGVFFLIPYIIELGKSGVIFITHLFHEIKSDVFWNDIYLNLTVDHFFIIQ